MITINAGETMRKSLKSSLAATTAVASLASGVAAYAEGELNLYSSRHYDTDERLYSDFTDLTGITINRIEGNADELIARMIAEGANSPADILLTVEARVSNARKTAASFSLSTAMYWKPASCKPAGRRQPVVWL